MASLALRRLPSAARPISCAHKTSASSRCSPEYRRSQPPLPRTSRGSRRDRRSPDVPAKVAVRHLRNAALVSFFCTATSGSSDVSSIAFAVSSSSPSVLPAPQRREGLEPRNRQQPGGDGGSAFELAGLTPHIEKNLADEIFRNLLVPHEPKPETEHPDMVPSVQHLHGEPVALSDPGDQDFV